MGGMGGMGGGGSMLAPPRSGGAAENDRLDLSASLFSAAQKRAVALVAMQYSGTSVDDAIAKFAAKIMQSLPGLVCVGWNWEATIDAERVRHGTDP